MGNFFASLPKNMLAFLAITAGIIFIILVQPPHSICDAQMDVINTAQARFLFKDPKSKTIETTRYERLRDQCKLANSPGGCYELFQELKVMIHDLGSLTRQCVSTASGVNEYHRALWESVELLIRLGWGEKPPASFAAKLGWLDTADLSLYCRLKERIVGVYGESSWDTFRERLMQELPGAKDMIRNQVWDLSLFSENCARYP